MTPKTTQPAHTENSRSKPETDNWQVLSLPLKFWEIDHFFKCPLVGLCLTLSEQKQMLKKSGIKYKNKSPFEIHEILVASSDNESRLSKRIDALLARKFKKKTAGLINLSHQEFLDHFRTAFVSGNYTDVTWAAATHPALPMETRRKIFGDIHMAMHYGGEQSIRLKQQIARQQEVLEALRSDLKQAVRLKRSLHKKNNRLKQDRLRFESALAAVEKEKAVLKEAAARSDQHHLIADLKQAKIRLSKQLEAALSEVRDHKLQLESHKAKNLQLITKMSQQQEAHRRLKKEVHKIISELISANHCDAVCPSYDLCQKRILIVGGITRMESLYRQLIEKSGGIFEYHDGYMKKGVKRLEGRLRRADLVVCPVNCNSHAACSIVKNLAKKHNKTVCMLENSSLKAVSQAIWNRPTKGTIN